MTTPTAKTKIQTAIAARVEDSSVPERIFVALMAVIFLVGLVGLSTDYFTLRYIPLDTRDSMRIGTTTKVSGNTRRRLALDPLWLYLRKGAVYNGDLVFTDIDGKAEIEIGDGDKFEIQPRSLVRISFFEGKFLIELRKGEVKADLESNRLIVVQDGREMKEVSLPKGQSSIKNDDELNVDTNEPPKKDEAPKANKIAQVEAMDQWDLPAPADKTVFLVQKESPILVSPKVRSVGSGKLTIHIPQKEPRVLSLSDGEQPVFWLDVPADLRGALDWTYKDLQGIVKGSFSVESFSEARLIECLKTETPVEVLQ